MRRVNTETLCGAKVFPLSSSSLLPSCENFAIADEQKLKINFNNSALVAGLLSSVARFELISLVAGAVSVAIVAN
jgi:hypothetical protein